MRPPQRENDATTKHLRTRLRTRRNDCHICGHPIDYDAHHTAPWSFQMDHLVQIANGGPNIESNVAAAHRACNRARSDKVDAITIWAAERLGITLDPAKTAHYPGHAPTPERQPCNTPDGQHCPTHRGTHNPQPGVYWVSERRWWR
ncbi:hypothetical protein OKHIL_17030 [Mycolicibacterium mageritense]